MPGSFINEEANKALEKNHSFYLHGCFHEALEAGAVYAGGRTSSSSSSQLLMCQSSVSSSCFM